MQSGKKLDDAALKDIRFYTGSMLDVGSALLFAKTCKLFKKEVTEAKYWKESKKQHDFKKDIIESGMPRELFDQVVQMNVVRSYENLDVAHRKLDLFRSMIQNSWELLMLSGEPDAVQYAIKNQLIRADTLNRWRENPLHVAVFSGKVDAVRAVMSGLNIDPNVTTMAGLSLYCLAAWRGEVEMIHYLHFLHQQGLLHHTPETISSSGVDAFHYARTYSPSKEVEEALAKPDLEMIAFFKEQQESEMESKEQKKEQIEESAQNLSMTPK